MKSNFKAVKNALVLFIVNILLYHLVMYLGIIALGSVGVYNINISLIILSVLYTVGLLLYEKIITQNYNITLKTYWGLTVVLPTAVYGVFWGSSYLMDTFIFESVSTPLYFYFFGIFFFFTVIISVAVKTLLYLIGKVRKDPS